MFYFLSWCWMIATLQKLVASDRMHEKRSTPAGQTICSWIFLRIIFRKNGYWSSLFHFSQVLNKTDSGKNILLIVFWNRRKSAENFDELFWLRFEVQIDRLAESEFRQRFLCNLKSVDVTHELLNKCTFDLIGSAVIIVLGNETIASSFEPSPADSLPFAFCFS